MKIWELQLQLTKGRNGKRKARKTGGRITGESKDCISQARYSEILVAELQVVLQVGHNAQTKSLRYPTRCAFFRGEQEQEKLTTSRFTLCLFLGTFSARKLGILTALWFTFWL